MTFDSASILTDKAAFTGQFVHALVSKCRDHNGRGVDGMRLIQMMAGAIVEFTLLFDESDRGVEAMYDHLATMLGCEPQEGPVSDLALPPAYIIDFRAEQGRELTRRMFEDWLHCAYEFQDVLLFVCQQMFMAMEEEGQHRRDLFRLLIECTNRCLGYEIAAQELCDIVIEQKIGLEGWSLPESISGLSAVSGRALALSLNAYQQTAFRGADLPEHLDRLTCVMTQEAVRLGLPAGSDWRFGLAANDRPLDAPYELIASLEPLARDFFRVIRMHNLMDQAVASAKATGRMLAVAAGGDRPEVEPVIAKPLAMAAMTETYKTVCTQYAIMSM
ncbi:hypothetical protein [Micavibrio aeruginosavorus]|uniref:Uncharacterized protein n=1 Tax=Micavibrio aeruginosavorus EPB TaxID=349215 RepID=M4VF81_9BACT|nr:hypothetical protein [Micavibrio aeruginosavorus]AGH97878.1 hypothetical protein A11S_1060 [Micavibrio aeruginosavorus EPB]